MQNQKLYDITEVCSLLHTTSRTLRFYEQKGIISSTVCGISARRHYTEEQLALIKTVLVLRKLGLSLKTISELQHNNADLKGALISKRAEIEALIDTKCKEIMLLNNALFMIEQDKDIFVPQSSEADVQHDPQIDAIIRKCTDAIICGNDAPLYEHLSNTMKAYIPPEAFRRIREDTLAPLGEFVSVGEIEFSKSNPQIAYHFVKYQKLGLKIKYVFCENLIQGLWMGYYEA